jgi:F420-dependent oxidoreductase-like protein
LRVGVLIGTRRSAAHIEALIALAADLERRGFASVWLPHAFGLDAVSTAALIGRGTSRIEIGTAVVPTQPRHPVALAQQALTTAAACRGRFTLGIGLSHPAVIEGMLGLSYARRAAHMREYLAVLAPLLRGEPSHFQGTELRVEIGLQVPGATPPALLLAALGERMLEIAGRETQGTILWSTGPRAIEEHVAPRVRAAARQAGRPPPRIVTGLHVVLTHDPGPARERVERMLAVYAQMPSYRAMIEREGGSADLSDLALVGDEATLDEGLARLRSLGVSDLEASIVPTDPGAEERTLSYLEDRAPELAR